MKVEAVKCPGCGFSGVMKVEGESLGECPFCPCQLEPDWEYYEWSRKQRQLEKEHNRTE